MEKKSKLLNIKAYYIIIAPIIFIAIIAILSTIAIILKEGETYDVCAEMVVAFALWLMPLGDLVCALVGLKSFKKKKEQLKKTDNALLVFTIIDFILVILPIAFVILLA